MCILWLFVRWRSFQAHWRFCMENCGWTGRWCAAGWRLCRSTKDIICGKVGGERCAGDLSDALNQYCSRSNPNKASPLPSVHLNTNKLGLIKCIYIIKPCGWIMIPSMQLNIIYHNQTIFSHGSHFHHVSSFGLPSNSMVDHHIPEFLDGHWRVSSIFRPHLSLLHLVQILSGCNKSRDIATEVRPP